MQKLLFSLLLTLFVPVIARAQNTPVPGPDGVYEIKDLMTASDNKRPPSFPGGDQALLKFLSMNIQYPAEAREANVQGKPVVTFVVEKDGSIGEVSLLEEVHPALDREAVRVISSMPQWTPGVVDGENVRVRFTLPVRFKLH